jgi:FKBP-type peptidyl-prolyl cis-trans isomerase (trigger factor)
MGFFSSLGSMLESVAETALESIADGIQKLSDAIPSPSNSSSSSSTSSSSLQAEAVRREAARRIAERESAVMLQSFFRKHHLTVTDAEIDGLVKACSSTSAPDSAAKFVKRYQETSEMQTRTVAMDALKAEIERLEQAAQAIRSLMAEQAATPYGNDATVAAQPSMPTA